MPSQRTMAAPRMKSGVSGVGSSRRQGSGSIEPPWMAASCCDSRMEEAVQAWAASGLEGGNLRGSSGSGATPRRLHSGRAHRGLVLQSNPSSDPSCVTSNTSRLPGGLVQPAKSVACIWQ